MQFLVKNRLTICLLLPFIAAITILSCNKWKDPAPVTDPRLTNPYCNDPDAVNYNWGFPGKPDNSKCFYPTDLFIGSYSTIDSVYRTSTGEFLYATPVTITVYARSNKKISVLGFCGSNDTLQFTAGKSYIATIDTLIGDTLTPARGQFWCNRLDTVAGTLTNSRLDTMLYYNLLVTGDTLQTSHIGKAKKL